MPPASLSTMLTMIPGPSTESIMSTFVLLSQLIRGSANSFSDHGLVQGPYQQVTDGQKTNQRSRGGEDHDHPAGTDRRPRPCPLERERQPQPQHAGDRYRHEQADSRCHGSLPVVYPYQAGGEPEPAYQGGGGKRVEV